MNWDNELGVWTEELIWCPSQCYYYFKEDDKEYCIYLRWRYNDPWTAELITKGEDGKNDIWEAIQLEQFYKDMEYKALEKAVISKLRSRFKTLPNPYKSNIKTEEIRWDINEDDL